MGVGMGQKAGQRGPLDHHHASALTHMGEIYRDPVAVQRVHGLVANGRKAAIFRLHAAIAQHVPVVIGELHNAETGAMKERQAFHIFIQRPAILPAHYDADLTSGLCHIEIRRALNNHPR